MFSFLVLGGRCYLLGFDPFDPVVDGFLGAGSFSDDRAVLCGLDLRGPEHQHICFLDLGARVFGDHLRACHYRYILEQFFLELSEPWRFDSDAVKQSLDLVQVD